MAKTTCKICGEEVRGLARHLKEVHQADPKQYYLRYVDPSAGRCVVCGRPTKFINLTKGFRKTCSDKCLTRLAKKTAERGSAQARCKACRHFVLKFLPNDGWFRMFRVSEGSPPMTAYVCLLQYRLAKPEDAACPRFEPK